MIAVILGEIAIKQANEINTMDARPTSTMELASRPFSLATRLAETNGMGQQMVAQWAIATAPNTPIGFVPQKFVQAATRARTVAVNAGYWSGEIKAAIAAPLGPKEPQLVEQRRAGRKSRLALLFWLYSLTQTFLASV